ncbi:tripartite tricarboxylate transporter substrate binding protein [Aquabacter sp. CN5-332]|uniref:Bug family tripartite tricarboxylate transporter substrate binding protein n=1 Tax=Aquabacter sp. CN5-332 TaxID=3156608 RepID=UPI0032B46D1A
MFSRAACAILAGLSLIAAMPAAQAEQPVSIVLGYTAGGTTDTIARVIAQRLQEKIGKTVIVEDKPGAAAQIASRYVAKSAPDGLTLQIATQTSHAAGQRLYANPGYDPVKDFTPISLVAYTPLVLVANKEFPPNSVKELIDYIKARPGAVNYATGGRGDGADLAGLFFNKEAGVNAVAVPYQGDGAAMPAVLGNHVSYMFVSAPTAMSGIGTGLIKPLAVTGTTRLPALPNIPTMQEAGIKDFDVELWWGMFGPAGMAPDLVASLNKAVNEVLKEPDTLKKLNELGYVVKGTTAQEFSDYVKSENVKWADILKNQGIATK